MARPCPITKEQFEQNAKPITIQLVHEGRTIEVELDPRQKDGKSLGWTSGSIRFDMRIAGVDVPMIGSINLSCIGSK